MKIKKLKSSLTKGLNDVPDISKFGNTNTHHLNKEQIALLLTERANYFSLRAANKRTLTQKCGIQ